MIRKKKNLQFPNLSRRTTYFWGKNSIKKMRLTATIKITIIDSKAIKHKIRQTCFSESKGLYSSSVTEAKTTVSVDKIAVILAQFL